MTLFYNYLQIPHVNPFKFVKSTNTNDRFFKDGISSLETPATYHQLWEADDAMTFQIQAKLTFLSKVHKPVYELVDCEGNVIKTFDEYVMHVDSDSWAYLHLSTVFQQVGANTFPEGTYYIRMTFTLLDNVTQNVYYSEPIDIAYKHEHTVLLGYRHSANDYGTVFQKKLIDYKTQIDAGTKNPYDLISPYPLYQLRVRGGLWSKDFKPSSDDKIYSDQTHDTKILSSIPFNVYRFTFGDNEGIPNWMIDKINRIFCCEYVLIDETDYYTKRDGASLEQVAYTFRFPKGAWAMDLERYDNAYTKIYRAFRTKPGYIGGATISSGFLINADPAPAPTFEAVLITSSVAQALDELNGEVIQTTIMDKIDGAKTWKEDIRQAIITKGVAVGVDVPPSDYDDKILDIGGEVDYLVQYVPSLTVIEQGTQPCGVPLTVDVPDPVVPSGWYPPADWLDISQGVAPTDQKFRTLFAVFENSDNFYAVIVDGNYTVNIYNDTTLVSTTNVASGVKFEAALNYADYAGTECTRGYRQAIIEIVPNGGNITRVRIAAHSGQGAPFVSPHAWLDVYCAGSNITSLANVAWDGAVTYTPILERFRMVGTTTNVTSLSFAFYTSISLKVFEITSSASVTSFFYAFHLSGLDSVPVLDMSSSANATLAFFGTKIRTIENLTNVSGDCADMFRNCPIVNAKAVDYSGATVIGRVGGRSLDLAYYTMMNSLIFGARVSHDYDFGSLSSAAQDVILYNLGAAIGSPTIGLTNNYGTPSAGAIAHANGLGWTVAT